MESISARWTSSAQSTGSTPDSSETFAAPIPGFAGQSRPAGARSSPREQAELAVRRDDRQPLVTAPHCARNSSAGRVLSEAPGNATDEPRLQTDRLGLLKLVANDASLATILWETDSPRRVRLGPLAEILATPHLSGLSGGEPPGRRRDRRLYRPGARLSMLMAAPRRPAAASITRGHLRKTLRSWSARAVTTS
jgi:hypothetical protein